MPRKLLNFSTHPGEPELFGDDWQFPWHWQDTLDICSEILNESLALSKYNGLLLFENLWWPGSFRLDSYEEYEYLRQRVNHDRCGIVLDTGHLLSSGGGFEDESAAIDYLLKRVKDMGAMAKEIHTVHLTCSLSGNYIRKSKKDIHPETDAIFWQQLASARKHVGRIDPMNRLPILLSAVFLPVIAATCALCMLVGKSLNGLLLGETYAKSMGLSYLPVRLVVITLTAILVGCVTAYCGPVAFIGIAVPHLARVVAATSDHRILLPVTASLGGVVALGADFFAQLPGHSTVLPLNAVTALIGSPVIIWFIVKRQKIQRSFV